MTYYTMQELRTNVAARIKAADETIIPDILDPTKTHDNLIRMIDRLTAPYDKGGLGYAILVTALNRDHSPDNIAALGGANNHGHSNGWSIDFWPQEESQLEQLLKDLASRDMFDTKIGLGGSSQKFYNSICNIGNKVVFMDNSSSHIHAQSA